MEMVLGYDSSGCNYPGSGIGSGYNRWVHTVI